MKILLTLTFLLVMAFCSCDKSENISTDTGKIIFYTNAQAMLNCGPFNVDVFINNDSIGTLSEPYIERIQPTCMKTASTLMIEKKAGKYNYSAKMNCGQYGSLSGECEIIPNTCNFVFLDILNCNP